jgi:uncharacterized protein
MKQIVAGHEHRLNAVRNRERLRIRHTRGDGTGQILLPRSLLRSAFKRTIQPGRILGTVLRCREFTRWTAAVSEANKRSMASGIPTNEEVDRIWRQVAAQFDREPHSIHGPDHWRRVERDGLLLASRSGANIIVVRLFALFHDSRRVNDGWDPHHGARGAEHAATLRGAAFHLSDEDFERLHYACTWHTDGLHHDDPTIGTCWDADRLDLGRVGITPNKKFMSTAFAREIADHGSIEDFLAAPPDTHRAPA